KPKEAKRVKGFQTGDIVRAVVTSGTKQGTYMGRVAVRTRGVFNIQTVQGTVTDIHYRFCRLVARSDGYSYHARKEAALPPKARRHVGTRTACSMDTTHQEPHPLLGDGVV